MVLEIVNSCLTHNLHNNPHLVYSLLYQREVFEPYRTHPSFMDLVQNVETVGAHSSAGFPVYLFVYLFVCLSVCLLVWSMSNAETVGAHSSSGFPVYLFGYLFVCLLVWSVVKYRDGGAHSSSRFPAYLFTCLFVCLFVYLFGVLSNAATVGAHSSSGFHLFVCLLVWSVVEETVGAHSSIGFRVCLFVCVLVWSGGGANCD